MKTPPLPPPHTHNIHSHRLCLFHSDIVVKGFYFLDMRQDNTNLNIVCGCMKCKEGLRPHTARVYFIFGLMTALWNLPNYVFYTVSLYIFK
jgi:hypothetical protein